MAQFNQCPRCKAHATPGPSMGEMVSVDIYQCYSCNVVFCEECVRKKPIEYTEKTFFGGERKRTRTVKVCPACGNDTWLTVGVA